MYIRQGFSTKTGKESLASVDCGWIRQRPFSKLLLFVRTQNELKVSGTGAHPIIFFLRFLKCNYNVTFAKNIFFVLNIFLFNNNAILKLKNLCKKSHCLNFCHVRYIFKLFNCEKHFIYDVIKKKNIIRKDFKTYKKYFL